MNLRKQSKKNAICYLRLFALRIRPKMLLAPFRLATFVTNFSSVVVRSIHCLVTSSTWWVCFSCGGLASLIYVSLFLFVFSCRSTLSFSFRFLQTTSHFWFLRFLSWFSSSHFWLLKWSLCVSRIVLSQESNKGKSVHKSTLKKKYSILIG